jgi:hypothetical protein
VDPLTADALDGLEAVFRSLLPEVSDPAIAPTIAIVPRRIQPTGLGGFVSLHSEPRGEIRGRQIDATVTVAARGTNADGSSNAAAAISRAVLGQAQGALRQLGILRVMLDSVSGPVTESVDGGARHLTRRDLAFGVLYEYLKLPEAAERVISEIPVDLRVSGA